MDAGTFLLRGKGNTNELNWLLAEQLKIYPKASHKLPEFVKNHCWFTSKSYEQASGESSALFKASIIQGQSLLDLSGGLGVDDWAFCRKFERVVSLDPDAVLNDLVCENFSKLGILNFERHTITAEEFLINKGHEKFDWVYLDADRRPGQEKTFFLNQVQPNILEIKDAVFGICKRVLLKVSPMADITYLLEALQNADHIWVVGDGKEVKELLISMHQTHTGPCTIEACVLLPNQKVLCFSNPDGNKPKASNAGAHNYFFEPHPVIIKSGLSAAYALHCGLQQIAPESAFYLGTELPADFMGRSFRLIQSFEFNKRKVAHYLNESGIKQANITRRNFVAQSDEIRKMFGLKDGGDHYLFFSTLSNGTRMFYHAKRD